MGLFLGDSQPSKIFVGDTPISKVFLGDTKIRPSGEEVYTFDFTQGYTGWTNYEGGVSVGTNGVSGTTNNNGLVNTNIDISNYSHIKYKTRFMSTNVSSRTGTESMGFQNSQLNSNFSIYNGLMTNNGYTIRLNQVGGGASLGNVSWSANTRYTGVMEIDLANNTATGTYKIYNNDESGTLLYTFNISGNAQGVINPFIYLEKSYVYVSNAEITLS